MPPKIRDLERLLKRAGFTKEPGKGSHRKYRHPRVPGALSLSGGEGDDAKPYQEAMVEDAISTVKGDE